MREMLAKALAINGMSRVTPVDVYPANSGLCFPVILLRAPVKPTCCFLIILSSRVSEAIIATLLPCCHHLIERAMIRTHFEHNLVEWAASLSPPSRESSGICHATRPIFKGDGDLLTIALEGRATVIGQIRAESQAQTSSE